MSMRRMAACSVVAGMLAGCRADDGGTGEHRTDAGDVAEARQAVALEAPTDPAVEARARAALDERLAEIEAAQQRLPGLIGSIRQDMRRHLNAAHVTAARRNGVGPVRDSAHLAVLVGRGDLVQLPDSTHWWVLRDPITPSWG